MKPVKISAACLALAASISWSAPLQNPTATIDNGKIKATLYLPDAKTGYYRGTRFDWSGIVNSLEYAGHNYYNPWFTTTRPEVIDYIYEGKNIVTGPCSSIWGVPEEFTNANHTPQGWQDAKVGGTFVKIGIGALRKPDNQPYSNYRLYDIVNGGKWTIQPAPDSIEFTQDLSDPGSGYAYVYTKRVSLTPGKPQMVLEHTLRNTGTRAIVTSVYDHNFTNIDRQPIGPGLTIRFGFPAVAIAPTDPQLLNLLTFRGSQTSFARTVTGQDKVAALFTGFTSAPEDYDIRIEDHRAGAGVHITADRPLSKVALWGIRTVIAPEPFIDMTIPPGSQFTWTITYDYYTLPKSAD